VGAYNHFVGYVNLDFGHPILTDAIPRQTLPPCLRKRINDWLITAANINCKHTIEQDVSEGVLNTLFSLSNRRLFIVRFGFAVTILGGELTLFDDGKRIYMQESPSNFYNISNNIQTVDSIASCADWKPEFGIRFTFNKAAVLDPLKILRR
jgi:hypothetical protein